VITDWSRIIKIVEAMIVPDHPIMEVPVNTAVNMPIMGKDHTTYNIEYMMPFRESRRYHAVPAMNHISSRKKIQTK
jgi:hypothetical protein